MELRSAIEAMPDVRVLYVIAERQMNEKTLRFIDGNGLRDRVVFLLDPGSAAIDRLGLRKANPEQIEEGVPHPATYVLDRQGIIRMLDVRTDYHIWIDPAPVIRALESIGSS